MRDSARTVWISPPERRGAHSTPDYGLRKKRQTAGRKAELTRSACYDWVTELPVTKRDRLTWSWRAGLLRSRAWSLVKPAGRGGQEGGTPRLPVGCLRRGARGDGRGDAQGGARSTETAPSFASPPPSRVSNLAASSRSHPLPGPPCSTARVARWEGILPRHSCSPGPPMVAALSACCLPLPWRSRAGKSHEAGGSREIWGFPLSSRHPSLPEAEGGAIHSPGRIRCQVWSAFSRWWEATAFPATRSSPRGSPSSWVMLPRPPQHPAPSPTSLASRCRGLSVFGSRMARHPVGATDEKQCQCPAAPCAQNQQLWNPSPRVHSWSHFRAVGWRFGWHFPRPSPAPFSFGSLVFSY
ncbi:uncharacterized protein [Bos taurus]|uniref:uncharacterized protein isoform X1 n=1 Tax=Bos taurus TaxID=9913 RepID=UPI000D5368FC|nr:uncharacterized protein LOC101904339 isoform X1 [Bos taurus]